MMLRSRVEWPPTAATAARASATVPASTMYATSDATYWDSLSPATGCIADPAVAKTHARGTPALTMLVTKRCKSIHRSPTDKLRDSAYSSAEHRTSLPDVRCDDPPRCAN